ncbi:dihydrolipoyl dehydrogenase [Geofilum rubicundum]|uniref:Dihydrolipoyl dehydrogenase n=1 Tax=Geofilum rubicundum JCM 15548 TaxID=1236989 RepID=A0A0E9LZR2_9BACT|nr:dihydrolipoyl dehydrogenase [Geofilum rubicundum]GAO30798.1 dihydrolipoamide dehydrogenase of pyruvate dehydrogenase complex [Geofilum rubicundum JCM 15548]
MTDKKKKTQLAIIGAGPGGYAAAFHAADLGLKVTLIDPRENPGGICLYEGCIPTKALLHFADVKEESEKAKEFGLHFDNASVDINQLSKWKDQVVGKLTKGLGQLTKARKINYVRAVATITDSHTLELTDADKNKSSLTFDKAIIATGSHANELPEAKFDHKKILDAGSALQLKEAPKQMLVVGAGYIGLEMSVIYQALGTKITIVEASSGILPGMSRDLAKVFQKERQTLLKNAHFNTKVVEVGKKGKRLKATYKNKEGQKTSKNFDKILVAVGQTPNTQNLGLEAAGIELGQKGFIQVNEFRQTNRDHIYAVGDVTGAPLLAHKATHEGRVAAEHVAGLKTAYEPKAIPAVVYTGLAWVGLTEAKAKEEKREVKIVTFPWNASGRAATQGIKQGLTKLIIDPENDRLLGAEFAGKRAGTLVAEATLAIEMGATAKDLELTIHPHPTFSETIMEAAELYYGPATHSMKSGA